MTCSRPSLFFQKRWRLLASLVKIKLHLGGFLELEDKPLDVKAAQIALDKLIEDLLDEGKIACDGIDHAGTANLDGHHGAVEQLRLVDLADGRGAQGFIAEGGKELTNRLSQILLDLGINRLDVHGRNLRTQLHKRVAVVRGYVFTLLGSDLSDLDKGRAQVLQDIRDDFRRDAVIIIVLFQDGKDLLESSAGIRSGLFWRPSAS